MNRKVIEYKVASAVLVGSLQDYVQSLIDLGWHPIGGICVNDPIFYQAMIKYEEEPENKELGWTFEKELALTSPNGHGVNQEIHHSDKPLKNDNL